MKGKGLLAVQISLMLNTSMNRGFSSDDEFDTEKSGLPKKESMPLTDEEKVLLGLVSGKEKKQYLKMLKVKYQGLES
jgi:hypothetical protein